MCTIIVPIEPFISCHAINPLHQSRPNQCICNTALAAGGQAARMLHLAELRRCPTSCARPPPRLLTVHRASNSRFHHPPLLSLNTGPRSLSLRRTPQRLTHDIDFRFEKSSAPSSPDESGFPYPDLTQPPAGHGYLFLGRGEEQSSLSPKGMRSLHESKATL
jgi:hypothetical protein